MSNWASRYLIKRAVSVWKGRTRKLMSTPGGMGAAWQWLQRMGKDPAEAMSRMALPKGGMPLQDVLAIPNRAVPVSLSGAQQSQGVRPFDPAILPEFIKHVEQNYPRMNVVRPLGAGAESGALLVAPSRQLRDLTGEKGHLVFKYGLGYPATRSAEQMESIGRVAPVWELRGMEPSSPYRFMNWIHKDWRGAPLPGGVSDDIAQRSRQYWPVWSWLEPHLTPTTTKLDEWLMDYHMRKAGITPMDLGRIGKTSGSAQLGTWPGRRGQGRLVAMDRGIAGDVIPTYNDLLDALTGWLPQGLAQGMDPPYQRFSGPIPPAVGPRNYITTNIPPRLTDLIKRTRTWPQAGG